MQAAGIVQEMLEEKGCGVEPVVLLAHARTMNGSQPATHGLGKRHDAAPAESQWLTEIETVEDAVAGVLRLPADLPDRHDMSGIFYQQRACRVGE